MKTLFTEAWRRMKLLSEDDTVDADIHSMLVLRTVWGCIGEGEESRQELNLTQQYASKEADESIHNFEFVTFSGDRPIKIVCVKPEEESWIIAPMRQMKHLDLATKWKSDGEVETNEATAILEVSR